MERDDVQKKEVAARKAEESRVRELKELSKKCIAIPFGSELLIPIEDLEPKCRATNIFWLAEEDKKRKKAKNKNSLPKID